MAWQGVFVLGLRGLPGSGKFLAPSMKIILLRLRVTLFLSVLWLPHVCLVVGEKGQAKPEKDSEDSVESAQAKTSAEQSQKTSQEVPTEEMESSSRRNENVAVYQIDTNVIKELNQRLGVTYEIVSEAPVERNYYAAEFGRSPRGNVILATRSPSSAWHGEVYEMHQNSVFNARTFFQVGPVQPSRENRYGAQLGGPLGPLGYISGNFSQEKIRGMVNGNVLVPLASERTPLTTNPERRPIVQRYLAAYPDELPNRTDIDPRALNTNAPQKIDVTTVDLRLDKNISRTRRISLFHELGRTTIDAFQLVAGQNPDTEIHTHRSRAALYQELAGGGMLELGFTFQRTKSVLKSEPNAVGPRVRLARQIEELGPSGQFPIDRAQNTFSWAGVFTKNMGSGRHTLTLGGSLTRSQLNGIETNDLRGRFNFTNAFGRSAIENLLYGTPSRYDFTLGNVHRGFRNWHADFFFGDRWQLHPRLQFYYGLNYSLETKPTEVNNLNKLPYSCDCNNFSPRLALAYRLGKEWVTRASYNLSFGPILPVTYSQIRNNLPLVQRFVLQEPDLVNPLRDIDLSDPGTRVALVRMSPDLVSPYSHQYNWTFEKRFANQYLLRFGYLGSRTFKLFHPFFTNRAEVVPGIPLTRNTIDKRRADQRFSDIMTVVNAGMGSLDAFQLSLDVPFTRKLAWKAVYTFSKAIDTGSDYSGTAANRDLIFPRGQNQDLILEDLKGPSDFHSPHALQFNFIYSLHNPVGSSHWSQLLLNDWQISGTALVKTGTPFGLVVGSDSPGFGNVDGGSADRPTILNPEILGMAVDHPDTAPLILSADRFDFIQPGEPRGTIGRNVFRKDAIRNFNLSISKQWAATSLNEWRLVFRVETYNLTNSPQFDAPNRNLTSASFGAITNALNDGRILQFGLQLIF